MKHKVPILHLILCLSLCIVEEFTELMKQKDEEIERLEGEVAEYRDDIDNMFTSFQKREQELRQEMTTTETKNQVSCHVSLLIISMVKRIMKNHQSAL